MADYPVNMMSDKQRKLLARLMDEKEIDDDMYRTVRQRLQNGTSSKAASGLITMLIAAKDKPGKEGLTEEGWYKHPETGVLYKVVRSRNGHLIALGCNSRTGKWTRWVRGMQFRLSPADKLDREAD